MGDVELALLLLIMVIVVVLVFDFTNGFHDTANAMATSIATGALTPRVAVALSAILNLVGAFLSVEVAITVTNAVVSIQDSTGAPQAELLADHGVALLLIVLCAMVGAIVWNLLTWLWGLPSSSSHALFGGLVGATAASMGFGSVNWLGDGEHLGGVIGKVIVPALVSPVVAGLVAIVGTFLTVRLTRGIGQRRRDQGFKWGQIGTASLMSLAHGTNDAQKSMGVLTLALIAYGSWTDLSAVPLWVKFACAFAIALGTWIGGWRIIRTMGKGLVAISGDQGLAAQSSSSAVILVSSHLGFALSTTHVATGSILGSGLGKAEKVNWGVAGRMAGGWLITLPASALMGAATWYLAHLLGGYAGPIVVCAVLAAASAVIWLRSRKAQIHPDNVNDDWQPDEVEPAVGKELTA